jgi:hypothetical protein
VVMVPVAAGERPRAVLVSILATYRAFPIPAPFVPAASVVIVLFLLDVDVVVVDDTIQTQSTTTMTIMLEVLPKVVSFVALLSFDSWLVGTVPPPCESSRRDSTTPNYRVGTERCPIDANQRTESPRRARPPTNRPECCRPYSMHSFPYVRAKHERLCSSRILPKRNRIDARYYYVC